MKRWVKRLARKLAIGVVLAALGVSIGVAVQINRIEAVPDADEFARKYVRAKLERNYLLWRSMLDDGNSSSKAKQEEKLMKSWEKWQANFDRYCAKEGRSREVIDKILGSMMCQHVSLPHGDAPAADYGIYLGPVDYSSECDWLIRVVSRDGKLRVQDKYSDDTFRSFEKKGKSASTRDAARPEETSAAGKKTQSTGLDTFFPVGGVILGKTTIDEIVDMGGVSEGKYAGKCVHYLGISFWDFDEDRVVEGFCLYQDDPMPEEWKRLGMSCAMSYDEWMWFFKERGFAIEIFEKPRQEPDDDPERMTLYAHFTAVSSSKDVMFDLNFCFGNQNGEGCSTSSQNSLFSIYVEALTLHAQ